MSRSEFIEGQRLLNGDVIVTVSPFAGCHRIPCG